jgi:hypothetical protein
VNTPHKPTFIAAALVGALAFTTAQAQQSLQVQIPKSAAEVSGPVSGTLMTKEYVQLIGRTAYFWGYAIVATSSRRDAFAKAPERILLGGVVPFSPIGYNTMLTGYIKPEQTFIVCPNQDVVYGGGLPPWTRSRRCSRCRTSANDTGSIRSTISARMKLARSGSNGAPNPAFT